MERGLEDILPGLQARPAMPYGLQEAVEDPTGMKHTPITSFLVPQSPEERMMSSRNSKKQIRPSKTVTKVEEMSALSASPKLRRQIAMKTGAAEVRKTLQKDCQDLEKTSTITNFFRKTGEENVKQNKSSQSHNNNGPCDNAGTCPSTSIDQKMDTSTEESSRPIGKQPGGHVTSKSIHLPMGEEYETQHGRARKSSHIGLDKASE